MKETINPIERVAMFWSANDDSWHSQETIMAVTELAPSTLANWRAQGRGPEFIRSGNLVYYKKSAIVEWFKSFQSSTALVGS